MKSIAAYVADLLDKKDLIAPEDRDFYQYSMECLLLYAINLGTLLIIAVLCNKVMEFLLFIIAYRSLRCYSGGFHTNKWYTCYFASCGIIFVSVSIADVIRPEVFWIAIIHVSNIIFVWMHAPVEHPNNPLDNEVRCKARKKAIVYSVINAVCCIVLWMLNLRRWSNLILLAVCLNFVLLAVGVWKSKYY